jgi:hypothetical protein
MPAWLYGRHRGVFTGYKLRWLVEKFGGVFMVFMEIKKAAEATFVSV